MGYCDVAVRGSERYRRCALELDIAIFVLCGLTSAARQMGVLKSPAGDPAGLWGVAQRKGSDQHFIRSTFLQGCVLLVQLFLALKVDLDVSVMRDFYAARIGHNDHIRWHDFVCLHFNLRMLTELCTYSACSKENTIRCA